MTARRYIDRQRWAGYVLLAGAVLVAGGYLALVIVAGGPPLMLLATLPALVLAVVGYKAIEAARRAEPLLSPRERAAHHRAGSTAFWVLLTTIMLDEWVRVLPAAHLHTSLIYVGVGAIVPLTLYHRYWATEPRGMDGTSAGP